MFKNEHAYKDLKEFEEYFGGKVNSSFVHGWEMARITNGQMGIKRKDSDMKIVKVKCPVRRRLLLCLCIIPAIGSLMFTEVCHVIAGITISGVESFQEVWQGVE